MLESNASIGGEQSGHIIISDKLPVGDGLLTLIYSLKALSFFKIGTASRHCPILHGSQYQGGSLERVLGSIVHFSAVPHCACDGRIRSLLHD